jgi:hypothetical protein
LAGNAFRGVCAAVPHFDLIEGNIREDYARLGLSREAVLKMCRFSLPPDYVRMKPLMKPKLAAATTRPRRRKLS